MKLTFKFFQIVLLIYGVCVAEADEVKTVSVMEGESVTLNSGVTETQGIILIQWRFGESGSTIAQMDRKEISYPSPSHIDIFTGKLQLDQTGSLTIKNMRTKHSGLYQLESDLNSGSSRMIFNVTVSESPSVVDVGEAEMKSVSVLEGNSVTLQTDVTETHGDELIVWRFGDEGKLIAKYDVVKSSQLLDTDERFRDRLQLDHQTGSLTITNTRNTDSGEYTLKINSNKQTFYKRFIVTVSDPGLSSGAVAGIVIVVLLLFAAAAVGVIYYQRKISELERQKERKILVKEGKNLIINPETEIQKDDQIQWRFRDILIAEIRGGTLKTHDDADDDGRFRGRLKLDEKTGSLIITDITTEHTGKYKLQIISSRGNTNKRFVVYVFERNISVEEGKNLIINPKTEIQKDDLILWRFGYQDILIAEIRGGTLKTHDDAADGRFRGRLKLDEKTGSLIITDITTEHTGKYKLQIISSGENTNKRFIVSVSERKISVEEGKNLIINPETEIQKDDQIQWRFGYQDILIAEIRGGTLKTHDDADDGRFRGRLKLDEKTGSLIITDITTEHTGKYKLQIISSRENTNKTFVVSVSERNISVEEGKNLIINPETEIQKDDLIQLRFGYQDILIAEIRGGTLKTHDDDDDGRFRGRLKLDEKTGSLIITDMTTEHTGKYKLQIISSRETTNKRFVVFVFARYISVEEGKNLIINPETEIQKDDQIQWRFGDQDILIAEISGGTLKTHDDAAYGRFRDRLKLDEKTGSLTITDITTKHTGDYKLQIISSREITSKRFFVSVSERVISVEEGKNLIINPETEIQKDDLILWRFRDILIAEIRGGTLKTHDDADGRFRGRLKLDEKTGSLIITDMTTKHTGDYKLQIISSRGNTNKRFYVSVFERIISVEEGKNLNINPETEIQKDDLILWRFGDILIAEIRGGTLKTHDDDAAGGRFRGRLKLDEKTGSLTITHMITELTGKYKLQIISSRGITNKRFYVFVSENISVKEGKNLIINPGTEIQKDDLILWRFGDILIAEIRGGTLKTHDDADDGIFRGRLKLDKKTGSLIITDMITKHTGKYKLQIISSRETTSKIFIVSVSGLHETFPAGEAGLLETFPAGEAGEDNFYSEAEYDSDYSPLNQPRSGEDNHSSDSGEDNHSSEPGEDNHSSDSVNISVEEGKNRILNPETEIQKDDLILWRFRDILIAEIRGGTLKTHDDADDGRRFRDRLKLDEKTGSLTITDMTTELTGEYKLQIISSRRNISKRFVVSVSERKISVEEGKNLIINPETEIQKDDLILWRFRYEDILIAEIRGGTLKTHDDAADGRFRGRLKLDEKTGSLIITDMITELTGDYKLQIISSRGDTNKRFYVSVFEREISVEEGKNLIINPETEIQKDDQIQLRFGYKDILIAEIRGGTLKTHDDAADGGFRGRLKLDEKTGSLTITDMITELTGNYKLQIISSRGNTNKRFYVSVSERIISVEEGTNLIINPETEIQKDDQIQWRFRGILIAEIRGGTLKTHDDADDGGFRGRLKLDEKTGSPIITDMITELTGKYKLQIISSRGNTNKRFFVSVFEREISVEEGKNLIINPETEIRKDDLIQLRFRDILIAEIRGGTLKTPDDADGRFRGRLKLDEKTGSLIITHMITELTGKYKLQIISSRGNTNKRFYVSVSERMISVREGKNLIINPETEIQKDDLILWRFGYKDILIAEIRGGTLKTHDDADDGRFRGRLKLDEKTGSLTITDITTEHTGKYKLQIISSGEITNKRFVVSVSDPSGNRVNDTTIEMPPVNEEDLDEENEQEGMRLLEVR
ncbi:uncharacterized protein LOC120474271 [Pimephales promelas]|uniref:uncharacterized protein LOC120474271 n=1 Tax=Pimephales promelas TaxID=90988 RepID=UPI0019556706|nr:uncharacterized protein LOC120474271 [Pimephales promelas]